MQSLRSWYTQWYPPSPTFTEVDVPSQVGKVFLVTGCNAGIGFELCKLLYATGATIYLTTRTEELGEETIKKITSTVPKPDTPGILKPLPLDLSDFESIKAAVKRFSGQETHLDVLWNNAGVGSFGLPAGFTTKQGLNCHIGINAVGPLLLTKLLLPTLQAAAKKSAAELESPAEGTTARRNPGRVRVVWASSNMVDTYSPRGGIDIELIRRGGSGDVNQNYAMSKVANWAFAAEMARRYGSGEDGIVAVAQNPGNLNTGAFKGAPEALMMVLRPLTLSEPKYGAYTELFAGLAPEVAEHGSGAYVIPWGRVMPEERMARQDIVKAFKPVDQGGQGLSEEFWAWCEDQLEAAD
ncbi:short-chain dehydrogenase [Colletotrichum plurivorum]|uniref:Short-chain dehydrogenase n=1 Tax=Colletotrichum plurivorum TaxID=2175906 RepID=A0A8H6MUH3_9PEZI|nr:short-chain dehydrogenase [Colletotrichum plurivorum]